MEWDGGFGGGSHEEEEKRDPAQDYLDAWRRRQEEIDRKSPGTGWGGDNPVPRPQQPEYGGDDGGGDDHHHDDYHKPEVPVYGEEAGGENDEDHGEHRKPEVPVYTAPETTTESTEETTGAAEKKPVNAAQATETIVYEGVGTGGQKAGPDASGTKDALTEEEEKQPDWMTYGAGTGRRSGEERADRTMSGYKPKQTTQPTAGNMTAPQQHGGNTAARLESQWFPKQVPTTGGGAVTMPEKVEAPKADIDRALAYNEDMRRQQALARSAEMARQLNGSIAAANAARYVPPVTNGYVPTNYLRENTGASYNPAPTTNGYVPTSGLREADAAAAREAAARAAQAEASIRYRDQMAATAEDQRRADALRRSDAMAAQREAAAEDQRRADAMARADAMTALREATAEDQRRADALARADATAAEREAAVAGSIAAANEARQAAYEAQQEQLTAGLTEGPIYVPTVTPEDAIQWNAEHEQGWNDAYAAADAEEQAQADRDKWVQDKAAEIYQQMQGETAVPGSVAAADEARQAQRESDAAFYTGIQEPTEYPLGSYENPIKRPMAQVRAEGQKRFNDALAAGKILTADGKVDTGGYAWDGSRTPVTRREGSGNSTLDLDTVMAEYDAGRGTPAGTTSGTTTGSGAGAGTSSGTTGTTGTSTGTTGTTGSGTGNGSGTGSKDDVPPGSQYFRPSYGQEMEKGVKAPYRKGGYSEEELRKMGNVEAGKYPNRKDNFYEGYYIASDGQYYPVDQIKANYYKRYGTYNGWQEGMRDYWNTFGTFYGYRPNWQTGRGGGGRRYYGGGGGGSSYGRGGSSSGNNGNNNGGIYWNANTSWSI